jgi:hypothetical protein
MSQISIRALREANEALKWFCARVDHGEVRSIQTYNRFKALIPEIEKALAKSPILEGAMSNERIIEIAKVVGINSDPETIRQLALFSKFVRSDFDAGTDVTDLLKECRRLIDIVFNYDGDVFGKHHNDATDCLSLLDTMLAGKQ